LNLSPVDAQIDPLTGNLLGATTIAGTITVSGRTLWQGQQTGTFGGTCEVREAATPAPIPLAPTSGGPRGAPWSLASGTFTISDAASAIPVTCTNVPAGVRSELLGSTDAGHNALSLGGVLAGSAPSIVAVDPTNPVVPAPQPLGPVRRPCVVPAVRGKQLDVAKKAIKKAGCAVGTISRRRSSKAASGVVLKQAAKAGATKAPGYHVRLRVAR